MLTYICIAYYDNTMNTIFPSTISINFPFSIYLYVITFLLTLFCILTLFGRLNVWQKFQYLNIPSNFMLVGLRDGWLGWDIVLSICRNCMFKCMQQINRFCVRSINKSGFRSLHGNDDICDCRMCKIFYLILFLCNPIHVVRLFREVREVCNGRTTNESIPRTDMIAPNMLILNGSYYRLL